MFFCLLPAILEPTCTGKEDLMDLSLDYAIKMDDQDSLHLFREEFYLQPSVLYMDGNSLGLMSKRAETKTLELMESWKTLGINGWTSGDHAWFYLSEKLGQQMAGVVGAHSDEVIVTGSTTVNLHQLLASFYKPTGRKTKILADSLTFPSDIYAIQSQIEQKGLAVEDELVLVESRDGFTLEEDDIIASMTNETAVIILPGVLYRSGQVLDMKRITAAAQEKDIIIGWDLSHSAGAVPHELHDWGADFAFWCTYKHLNGGPGSVGALFVHEKHSGRMPGLSGWFGSDKEKQFDMKHTMTPALDAGAYQIGTPHVLSLAPLLGSLEITEEAGIHAIREKSLQLTDYMSRLIEEKLNGLGFSIVSPPEHTRRGAHLFIEHPEAAGICKALKNEGVVPDFRMPNGIRLAPAALYTSFEDVWHTITILENIMSTEAHKQYDNTRDIVS